MTTLIAIVAIAIAIAIGTIMVRPVTFREYLMNPANRYPAPRDIWLRQIECADGFTVSAQASDGHYCTPRANAPQEYTAVELGFPSEGVSEWMEYAEPAGWPTDNIDPCNAIYPYIPVEIVQIGLNRHGRIRGVTTNE